MTASGNPSVVGALHRLLWRPFYLSALLIFLYTVAQLAQPVVLELLLTYLQSREVDGDSERGPPKWHGWVQVETEPRSPDACPLPCLRCCCVDGTHFHYHACREQLRLRRGAGRLEHRSDHHHAAVLVPGNPCWRACQDGSQLRGLCTLEGEPTRTYTQPMMLVGGGNNYNASPTGTPVAARCCII